MWGPERSPGTTVRIELIIGFSVGVLGKNPRVGNGEYQNHGCGNGRWMWNGPRKEWNTQRRPIPSNRSHPRDPELL